MPQQEVYLYKDRTTNGDIHFFRHSKLSLTYQSKETKMYDINKIRRKEYPGLNRRHSLDSYFSAVKANENVHEGTCYLDYGGATPYAKSLIDITSKQWKKDLLGNPHSNSASSLRATEYVEQARQQVLEFFHASPESFDVVFVANATAAIKLVAHALNEKGFWYGYHADSHTSLVGVRELAKKGYHCFSSDKELEEWIACSEGLGEKDRHVSPGMKPSKDVGHHLPGERVIKLIGYPAQSNMNGHRTPKEWAKRMRLKRFSDGGCLYTLLDAAAFCSSAQLDLSDPDTAADFVSVSFYKIFGMPDLGALIVRKDSSAVLTSRRYFGGGTVDMVTAFDSFHAKKAEQIHEALEDGTLPFHNLVMLNAGIFLHKRLFHSMDEISKHSSQLALLLYRELSQLQHANGSQVCKIHKDAGSTYGDSETQGPTVAFSVRKSNGAWVHYDYIEALASACNIQIRTGGVCNPGGISEHLELANWELRRNYCEGFRCGGPFKIRGGKPSGITRASLGAMSNARDVKTLVAFIKFFFLDTRHEEIDAKISRSSSSDGHHDRHGQRSWSVKTIRVFPIQHCVACEVPIISPWELRDFRIALDSEWCLVALEPKKVLRDDALTENLATRLNPEFTKLFLTTSVDNQGSSYELDLWELPTGEWVSDSLEQSPNGTYRMARLFESADLQEYLTRALGCPTTLARFYELKEIPTEVFVDKTQPRKSADGIFVQFSGNVAESNVHILLSATTSAMKANTDVPQKLRFGSQELSLLPWHDWKEQAAHKQVIGRYYRVPDLVEDTTSQNRNIDPTKIVFESQTTSTLMKEEVSGQVELYCCPVVGCSSKSDNYDLFMYHLKAHGPSFVKTQRRCWFR